jgi:hypothetical protein
MPWRGDGGGEWGVGIEMPPRLLSELTPTDAPRLPVGRDGWVTRQRLGGNLLGRIRITEPEPLPEPEAGRYQVTPHLPILDAPSSLSSPCFRLVMPAIAYDQRRRMRCGIPADY